MENETPLNGVFRRGIWTENPVFTATLGLCPALAVTNTLVNALAMSAATAFVLIGSSLLVSLLRSVIPKPVRISVFILVIATFVTTVDFLLAALAPEVHKQLGAFISLIVVNCLILGRQEAFASRQPVGAALRDSVGMSVGFTLALVLIGGVRELLGLGTLGGVSVLGPRFEPWVLMGLPPGGFLSVALILVVIAAAAQRAERRQAPASVDRRTP